MIRLYSSRGFDVYGTLIDGVWHCEVRHGLRVLERFTTPDARWWDVQSIVADHLNDHACQARAEGWMR